MFKRWTCSRELQNTRKVLSSNLFVDMIYFSFTLNMTMFGDRTIGMINHAKVGPYLIIKQSAALNETHICFKINAL